MATALILDTNRGDDGTVVVTAAGEIDLSNVDTFNATLARASETANGTSPLIVDLTAVQYLDSSAINVLFAHADRVDRLILIVHPLLMPVLNISGLSALADLESAPAGEG
ncbi:MAG: STAS domain-containing protein [Mycobacterium sp.]